MTTPSTSASDRSLRVVLPVAVGLLVAAAWVSDRGVIRHDLQIVAPNHVAPGDTLPVRAFLFERDEGLPQPRAVERVALRLVPLGSEEVVARGEAKAAVVLGLEGGLTIPGELPPGDYRLLGSATVEDKALLVSRRLRVENPPVLMERRGRPQTDAQRFELGPVRAWTARDDQEMGTGSGTVTGTEGDPREGVRLDVRVVGGDCSPPAPCELLVDLGARALAVRWREGDAWIGAGPECDGATARLGVARCFVSGSANARTLDVVALEAGRPIAHRRVQLPLGSASPALTELSALQPLGARPSFLLRGPLDEPNAFVVDLFHDERWLHTESVRVAPGQAVILARALDRPGLWRVQARSDPFGADHAATRLLFVGDRAALARSGYPEAWRTPLPPQLDDVGHPGDEGEDDDERAARFVLASAELELVTMPGLTRSAQQAEAGLHETQGIRRWAAALLILLAGFLVASAIVRRGLSAGRQATRLIEAAGGEVRPSSRAPVVGAGLFTFGLFVAVAGMVLSRGCL